MKKNDSLPKGEIIIYRTKDKRVNLKVQLTQETIWLSQLEISKLFQTERSVISKHLSNIFKSNELDEKSNVQKMHIAFSDKPIRIYNLDVIISVGYRVNSRRATQFRIWATRVLKEHILQGYTLNQKRLLEQTEKFKELQKAITNLLKSLLSKLALLSFPRKRESRHEWMPAFAGMTRFRMSK